MTVSATTLGLLYGGATVIPAAAAAMDGALLASVTDGEAGLSAAPLEAQLLDLSFADDSGTTIFDVVGAWYGASTGTADLLAAYTAPAA